MPSRLEHLARRALLVHLPLRSRAARIASILARSSVLACAAAVCVVVIRPIVLPPMAPLPAPSGEERFGLGLRKRRAIFAELAADQESAAERGREAFPDDPWSAQDHRGAFERDDFRAIAQKHGVTLTQVHLVFDEGIREHWTGPDDRPIDPTVVPLRPRRRW
jgi:hypothetical protein